MLTNVSMWVDNHGRQRTTADSISSQFPSSVSSDTRIFLCEQCNQYVSFINGIREPHFKHPRGSEDCEEKATSDSNYYRRTNPLGFSLPLRVKVNDSGIEAFIGFLPMTPDRLHKAEQSESRMTISSGNRTIKTYNIDSSRFSPDRISWLSIGNNFAERYQLHYAIGNSKLYWPTVVDGFSESGTLFDSESGKRLPRNANVVVNNEYLLFTRNRNLNLRVWQDVIQTRVNTIYGYNIFRVKATKLSRPADDFFRQYNARLSDRPAELTEIYPFAKKSSHVIIHTAEQVWFYKSEGLIK